jgi:hypothetical protein
MNPTVTARTAEVSFARPPRLAFCFTWARDDGHPRCLRRGFWATPLETLSVTESSLYNFSPENSLRSDVHIVNICAQTRGTGLRFRSLLTLWLRCIAEVS